MMPNDLVYTTQARIPTTWGEFQLLLFKSSFDSKEHLAFVLGEVSGCERVLTRVHSECFTGDVLGSTRCDCGPQLHDALEIIQCEGRGVLIYLRQEGRGIGLAQKLRAYNLQDLGHDTVDANLMLGHEADERRYDDAVAILKHLQVRSICLLTNNPLKIEHLLALGIHVEERVPIPPIVTSGNSAYLQTKIKRMGHLLPINTGDDASSNETGDADSPAVLPFIHHLPANVAQQLTLLQQEAHSYFAQTGLPHVTLSYAQSLDGSIAAAPGHPIAISSPESMQLTHALRASHDAILIGVETQLSDNPRLNVRLVKGPNPQPVVVDSHLRISTSARLFEEHPQVVVATLAQSVQQYAERYSALKQRNVSILPLPANAQGQVDLCVLLQALGERKIRSLMVEGGSRILTSMLMDKLARYVVVTVAPSYVGGYRVLQHQEAGTAASSLFPPSALPRLLNPIYTPMGTDMVVWGAVTSGA